MLPNPDLQQLLAELETLIETYSKSTDPDIQRIVKKLQKANKKLTAADVASGSMKALWLADKLFQLYKRFDP